MSDNDVWAELVSRKQQIDTELADSNAKVRGKQLSSRRYEAICELQNQLKKEKAGIETQLAFLRAERRRQSDERFKKRMAEATVTPDTIKEIVAIRDKYQEFSADKSRISSMRVMASQVALDLTKIIRASKVSARENQP